MSPKSLQCAAAFFEKMKPTQRDQIKRKAMEWNPDTILESQKSNSSSNTCSTKCDQNTHPADPTTAHKKLKRLQKTPAAASLLLAASRKKPLPEHACHTCKNKLPRNTTTILFHFVIEHSAHPTSISCPKTGCVEEFTTSESLRKHMLRKHPATNFGGRKSFMAYCSTCEKAATGYDLDTHKGHELSLQFRSLNNLTKKELRAIKTSFIPKN